MKPLPGPTDHTNKTDRQHSGTTADKWLSKEEVLSLLFISGRTLQHWRSNGTIPYSRIGNKIYYRQSDIEALLESRKVNG